MTSRGPILVTAAIAIALVAPGAAHADVYCVHQPASSCAAGTTDKGADLQAALTAAQTSASVPDRIEMGPGDFQRNAGFTYSATGANTVDIVGSGRGVTTVSGPSSTSTNSFVVLNVAGPSGTHLSDFTVRLPGTAGGVVAPAIGLLFQGSAERIATGELADARAIGIDVGANSSVRDCTVTGRGGTDTGITINGANGLAENCTVRGTYSGLQGASGASGATFRRMDVRGVTVGVFVGNNASPTVSSSVLQASLFGAQVRTDVSAGSLRIANSTLVSATAPNSGYGVFAEIAGAGGSSSVTLDSSIIRGFGQSLFAGGTSSVVARYSDYDPSTNQAAPSGTIDQQTANVNADPLFVNAAAGDYRLVAGSPVIDRANPAPLGLVPDSPGLDGLPRPTDGDGNGSAVPDMGAYESAAKAVPVSPPPGKAPPDVTAPVIGSPSLSATRFAVGAQRTATTAATRARKAPKGTKVRLRLSEKATVTLRIDRISKGRRKGRRCVAGRRKGTRCTLYRKAGSLTRALPAGKSSVKFSGRVGRRALKPGRYRFVLRAKDAAGNRSKARTLKFTVVRR